MEKKKFKINIFDIIIVVLVLAVAGGLYAYTHRDTVIETKKLEYVVEINDCAEGFSENIKIGAKITDGLKNYNMGTVTEVSAEPYTVSVANTDEGRFVESEVGGRERVLLTISANVTETDSNYAVDGYYVVKAGKEVFVRGEGFAGEGYIVSVKR